MSSAAAPAQPSLGSDLWALAQRTAGGRGFQFSPECASEVQNLIQSGVATLAQDGALGNAAAIAEAKNAVDRLVDKIIEFAIEQQRRQTIKGTEAASTNMLHGHNFFSARMWFCPCYPFC